MALAGQPKLANRADAFNLAAIDTAALAAFCAQSEKSVGTKMFFITEFYFFKAYVQTGHSM